MKCLQLGVADASGLEKCRTGVCSALKALGIPVQWVDNGGLAPSTRAASLPVQCDRCLTEALLHSPISWPKNVVAPK